MKELSEERAKQLHDKHWGCVIAMSQDIAMLQEAYRLGQQEAGVDEQRFRAACAALSGYNANCHAANAAPEYRAQWSCLDADALIAELNRTASDAEKGGEG